LSRAIHWLNVSYAVWFNRRHGRSGHLLQGRFKSVVVEPEGWGLEVSRYVHLNPARVRRLGLGKRELQRSRSVVVERVDAEQVQGEKWDRFRDRYGDVGRDLVLHLGRTVCGMSIRELSQRAEIAYVSAATALRRFAARAREDREIAKLLRRTMSKLNNEWIR